MTIYSMIENMMSGGLGFTVLIIVLSLVQVSPLKLSPWNSIFSWIGKKVNGPIEKNLNELQKQVTDMWVNSHRQTILTFAREARAGIEHSSDEWTNVLNQAEDYEKYVHDHKITNGIVTQDTAYIRSLYQELSRDHRI